MKMRATLLSGETVRYEAPNEAVAAFLRRVMDASEQAETTVQHLLDLVFGPENPLLDKEVLPGAGIPTVETYRDPIFHLMLDCIAKKQIPDQGTVLAVKDRYKLSVPEVAKLLGISQSAVRQAIYTSKLRARREGNGYLIDPDSVATYRVSKRGPRRRKK